MASRVSPEEVLRIAALAKLAPSEAEAAILAGELASILGHMDVLAGAGELASDGPSGDTLPPASRTDVPSSDPLAFGIAELSESAEAGFFTVPRLAAME